MRVARSRLSSSASSSGVSDPSGSVAADLADRVGRAHARREQRREAIVRMARQLLDELVLDHRQRARGDRLASRQRRTGGGRRGGRREAREPRAQRGSARLTFARCARRRRHRGRWAEATADDRENSEDGQRQKGAHVVELRGPFSTAEPAVATITSADRRCPRRPCPKVSRPPPGGAAGIRRK